MRRYEVEISTEGFAIVNCYDDEGLVPEVYEIVDKVIVENVLKYALKCATNHKGTRVLKDGQAAIINSIIDARTADEELFEQDTWVKAVEKTLVETKKEIVKESQKVIRLFPRNN